jgi:uncharacterized glyoxalase superfamily protein PhnB
MIILTPECSSNFGDNKMIEIKALFPVMVANNLDKIKQFYEIVFGFNAVFYDPDFYLHLISSHSGAQLGFLVPNHDSQPDFLHPIMSRHGYVITLEVKDARAAYIEAEKLALNFVMPIKEESWGQIHFMVQDPAGFRIDVVQHLEVSGNG